MSDKKVKLYKGNLVEFEIFKLVDYYDPILRTPTKAFEFANEDAKDRAAYLSFSMAETLERLGGIGLSANQVGLDVRLCVVNMGNEIWSMFNPEIINRSGELNTEYQEGCLSYPGLYLKIPRDKHIKVRFQAIGGQVVEHEFDGLTAVCVQHEIDHLNGVAYTDLVSPIKLDQAKRKVKTNLKKMRAYLAAQKLAEETKEQQEPSIRIMDPTETPKKTAEKFVYNVG